MQVGASQKGISQELLLFILVRTPLLTQRQLLEDLKMLTIDDILASEPSLLIEPRFHPILKKASRPNLYRWLQTGRLVGFQMGSRWLTTDAAVMEFLRSRAVKPAPDKAFLELRKKQVDAAEAKFASRKTRKK